MVAVCQRNNAEGMKLATTARQLAGDVRAQQEAALARLVADTGETHPADLSFAQPGLLYWRTDGGDHRGSLADIESYYRRLRRGRLVVLGEAGAGKTVLAITLIRDLAAAIADTALSQEGSGSRVMVPVQLSLPAFDPALKGGKDTLDDVPIEQVAKRLEQWLVGHLCTVYGVPKNTAASLVTQGWILPVLDGLDEMDPTGAWPQRAAAVLRALNHPTTVGLRPLVLTCRTDRYAQLTGHPLDEVDDGACGESLVVQDATVVAVEPLSVPDVIAYLSYRFPDPAGSGRCEQRWRPVVDRLAAAKAGDPLVVALRSPLRLFVAITNYRTPASDPAELTQYSTTGQLDAHLFGLLVPAVTDRYVQRSGTHYRTTDVTRWLRTLARHLDREGQAGRSGSDLRLDELWSAAGDCAPRYLAAAVLVGVCAAGVISGVLSGLDQLFPVYEFPAQAALDPGASAVAILNVAMLIGASAVSMIALIAATWGLLSRSVNLQRADPSALRTSTGRRRLTMGLAVGLAGGVVNGLAYALHEWLYTREIASARIPDVIWSRFGDSTSFIVENVVVGLAVGLAGGLLFGLAVRPAAIDLPHRLVSQGLSHTLDTLAGGFLLGLLLAPMTVSGDAISYVIRLLAISLSVGLLVIRHSPWPRYAVACMLLARRGELPWRPAMFLDWAYSAGLVRLSGIAVQFRHRKFQAWLITHRDELESPASPSPAGTAPVR
jgi:hypothetical protein